jgi:hypothetical protein
MEYDAIGVCTNYPVEFGGHSLGVLVSGERLALLPASNVTLTAEAVVAPHIAVTGTPVFAWSVLSGPGGSNLSAPSSAVTDVTMSEPGDYVVRVQVDLDGMQAVADTTVTLAFFGFSEWADLWLIPPDLRGWADDPYGTGLRNLEAYVTGLAPNVPGPAPLSIRVAGQAPLIAFPWRTDITPAAYYAAEASTNLAAGWNPTADLDWATAPLGADRVEVRGTPSDPALSNAFYRLRFGITE